MEIEALGLDATNRATVLTQLKSYRVQLGKFKERYVPFRLALI